MVGADQSAGGTTRSGKLFTETQNSLGGQQSNGSVNIDDSPDERGNAGCDRARDRFEVAWVAVKKTRNHVRDNTDLDVTFGKNDQTRAGGER